MLPFVLLTFNLKVGSLKENELLVKIADKDEKAFDELYEKYSKLIYSVILAIIKNQDDAVEILQEVFLTVWKKAAVFNSEKGNVYSWLISLTRNLSIDRLRSKKFRNKKLEVNFLEAEFYITNMENTQLDAMIISEKSEMIKNALLQIPEDQKEVLTLAYFEGYTQAEIAELLNIPLGTVKTRTRSAILKLQELILYSA